PTPRVLFFLEHAIQDASLLPSGERRTISRRMLYVEMDADGRTQDLHYAPYLDYRPVAEGEPTVADILARPECTWITGAPEQKALSHAVAQLAPEHIAEDLGVAAGGAGRARCRAAGTPCRHDRPRTDCAREPRRHPGFSRPRPCHRDGGRARPWLRAHRPRTREARLRHRKPHPRHRQAEV